jgi:hypothetical protein
MKRMKSQQEQEGVLEAAAWDTERAAELARKAYKYVARWHPLDAPLEPLGRADMAVLEAQERRDWQAYEDALREMCGVAKREAQRRAA